MFFNCEWFPSELRLLQPPEDIMAAEWAERHIYVAKSVRPGPWRNENNPPLVGIMNAADRKGAFKKMKFVAVLKGVQTGVTTAAHIVVLRRMDGSAQNALLVMESERKMRRVMRQRVLDMMRRSPRLAEQMSDNPDDTTNYSVVTRAGFCLNTGWAGSQAAVASDACETVVLDEVDKYDTPLNIEEAKDRITTYGETGLVFTLSTPGIDGGPIAQEISHCDAMMDYHVQCPDCGRLQPMRFENFSWPGKGEEKPDWKRLANKVQRERAARYACLGCGSLWDDYARDRAVRGGLDLHFHGWKMREEVDFPVSVGFHFPSWLSPFKSLSDVAGRWLRAQEAGQTSKLRMWHNNEAALPYAEAERGEGLDDKILFDRREKYGPELPMGVAVLTCGADVQMSRIECDVVGWGRGEESWGIEHKIFIGDTKRPEVWAEFDAYRKKTFRHSSGTDLRIAVTCIDAGDGNTMKQVCDFVRPRQSQRVYAVKGSSRPAQPIIAGRPSFANKYKITLFFVGTDTAKSIIHGNLCLKEPGPGFRHFNHGYDEEFFRQLAAEKSVTIYRHGYAARRWEKPPGRRNEALDITVYSLAALEILKTYRDFDLDRLASEIIARAGKEEEKPGPEAKPAVSASTGRPRGGWMKGWRK